MSNFVIFVYQSSLKKTDFVKILEGFSIFKQKKTTSCGPCAVRMCLNYLGITTTEEYIASHCGQGILGTFVADLTKGYNRYLQTIGLKAKHQGNTSYEEVKKSLENSFPVLYTYMCQRERNPHVEYKPSDSLDVYPHYSILIGLDEPKNRATVINPFGYKQELTIENWWEQFCLDDSKNELKNWLSEFWKANFIKKFSILKKFFWSGKNRIWMHVLSGTWLLPLRQTIIITKPSGIGEGFL